MAGNIWVLAEHWRGQISETTYEVLALGRELADSLGVKLEAVLLGNNNQELAASLGKADAVLHASHPALAEPLDEPYSEALAQMAQARQPRAVLIPLTNVTLSVGTFLAARLGLPVINACKDIRVSGGLMRAICTLYGGKMEVVVAVKQPLAVLGVWPGARPGEQGRAAGAPPIEEIAVNLPGASRVQFKRYVEPEAGDVDISQQDILVAVGRGIQSKDNVELAEELAGTLGGAVCGSRPVIDQGWLPLARQVGKSGVSVKSKLYFAAGISGAPEHVEGIRNAGLIVAINTDPQAPVFNVAHYGIVADALDLLPALTGAVRGRKN